jgi:hypothetical protein
LRVGEALRCRYRIPYWEDPALNRCESLPICLEVEAVEVRPAIVRAGVLSCQLLGKSSGLDNATGEAVHGTEGGHTSPRIELDTKAAMIKKS